MRTKRHIATKFFNVLNAAGFMAGWASGDPECTMLHVWKLDRWNSQDWSGEAPLPDAMVSSLNEETSGRRYGVLAPREIQKQIFGILDPVMISTGRQA